MASGNESVTIELLIDTAGAQKTIGQAKKEVQELNKLLMDPKISEQYGKGLTEALGKSKAQFKDLKKEVDALDPDARAQAFVNLGKSIAGGFAVATGAIGLFGGKSEFVAEAQKKAASAIALVAGIQSLANVQDDIAIAKKVAHTAATGALATAQTALTVVMGAGTTAMKVFRLALAATGIGAIALLVFELYQNFDKVKTVLANILPQGVIDAFKNVRDILGNMYEGIKNVVGLSEPVKTTATSLTVFGGALQEISKPLTDIPGKLKEMNAETAEHNKLLEEQAAAMKQLTDSGAVGSVGRYSFLLSQAKEALDKIKPGTDAYTAALAKVTQAQLDLNKAQDDAKPPTDLFEELTKNMEAEYDLNKKKVDAILQLEKDAADVRSQQIDDAKKQRETDAQEQIDANKEEIAFQKEKDKATLDAALQLTSQLLNAYTELARRKAEAEVAAIEEAKNAQLTALQTTDDQAAAANQNLLNNKSISQAEFDKREATRKAKLAKDQKAIEDKAKKQEADAKTKAWKAERAANIINAIIATALAVATNLKYGPVVAAIAGAAGAVQIGLIASQPVPKFKRGGKVNGPGTGTSDSIPALLSNGEFVMNARSTSMFGSLLNEMNNAGRTPRFAQGGLVGGGTVQAVESNSGVLAEIADSVKNFQTNQRVYVVESDMTSSQRRVQVLESRGRI